jgi:hypothetical protein
MFQQTFLMIFNILRHKNVSQFVVFIGRLKSKKFFRIKLMIFRAGFLGVSVGIHQYRLHSHPSFPYLLIHLISHTQFSRKAKIFEEKAVKKFKLLKFIIKTDNEKI